MNSSGVRPKESGGTGPSGAAPPRDPWFPALILAGVLVRLLRATSSPLINADAYFYLEAASRYGSGAWAEALRMAIHPFYPLIVAGFELILPDGWVSGAAVSLICSAVALAIFYAIVNAAWGQSPARFATFLFAVHPVIADMESKVMTEALYHAAALGAIWFLGNGLLRGCWKLGAAAGGCLAVAHLTRAEGVMLALLAALASAVFVAVRRFPGAWKAASTAFLVLAIGSAPYVLWMRAEYGVWKLSPRGSVKRAMMAGSFRTFDDSDRERVWRDRLGPAPAAARLAIWQTVRALSPVPMVLATAALVFFRRGGGGGPFGVWLALIGGGQICAIMLYYYVSFTHISLRYVSLPAVLGLPWAGWGWRCAADWLGRRRPAVAVALAVAVVLALVPRSLKGWDGERAAALEAAAWLRENRPRARLAGCPDSLAYHARARYVPAQTALDMLEEVRAGKVEVLAVEERDLRESSESDWNSLFGEPGVRFVKRFGEEGRGVRVYDVEAESREGSGAPARDGR